MQRVKIAHSFLQSVSNQFHVIILSLPMYMLNFHSHLTFREWSLNMTGVGAEDFFQNKKKISSLKAKMCGRFQIPTLIMAINFIPQLRYPRANCHRINCTAHKKNKQSVCL